MKQKGQLAPGRAGAFGFTLIEILVASAVLAIVAVGSAASIVTTPRLMRSADESTAVRSAVHGMVSELTGAEFSQVIANYDGASFAVPGVTAVADDPDGQPGSIAIESVGVGAALYYKITLSVTWSGINGAQTVQSLHYVSNVRGDTAPVTPPESLPQEPTE